MKILVAGDGRSSIHEKALAKSLKELGHDIVEFYWNSYFQSKGLNKIWKRVQEHFLIGPALSLLNADFLQIIKESRPEMIFLYRGTHIFPSTIQQIRSEHPQVVILGYNNDDPFSPQQARYKWRNFVRALRLYDLVYAYRPANQIEYLSKGANRAEILKPWFSRSLHYPVQLTEQDRQRYACDVVFIGHFEPDHRATLITRLLDEGIHVRLYGPAEPKFSGWSLALNKHPKLKRLAPFNLVWGEDYNKAIEGSKIALCFMSKLNRDQYTRRCFEIPAVGGFLFSEYTKDLAAIFKEGTEAEYFRNEQEFVDKIKYYLVHEEKRKKIAEAGFQKVSTEGHDAQARAAQVVKDAIAIRKAQLC